MKDPSRTNQELIDENALLKQRIQELEQSESGRNQVEEALQKSEDRYRQIAEGLSDYLYTVRIRDGQVVETKHSLACAVVTGYTEEDFEANPYLWLDMVVTEDRDRILEHIQGILTGKNIQSFEHRIVRKDGQIRWVSDTPILHPDSQGRLESYDGVIRDITELKQAEETLRESENRYRELSIVDDLTQLYNSRYFYHQIKMEIDRVDRYGHPLTLLLLDLDDFKRFNDAYGHIEGDQVLLRLGQVVKRCLRETDSAYRYGGEEFTILLPMTTSGEGVVTAERIRTEFRKETFSPVSGQEVHMTVSIGLAQYKTKEEIKAFVHRADQWMYQGKKNGKDRVCSES